MAEEEVAQVGQYTHLEARTITSQEGQALHVVAPDQQVQHQHQDDGQHLTLEAPAHQIPHQEAGGDDDEDVGEYTAFPAQHQVGSPGDEAGYEKEGHRPPKNLQENVQTLKGPALPVL